MSKSAARRGEIDGFVLLGRSTARDTLSEARWLSPEAQANIPSEHPGWRRSDGGCPAYDGVGAINSVLEVP